MTAVELSDLRTLEELLARIEAGEDIVIMRDGRQVARVTACTAGPQPGPLRPGTGRGYFVMADDFDDPLPEEILSVIEGPVELDLE